MAPIAAGILLEAAGSVEDRAYGVAGDQQLLVGGDDEEAHAGALLPDLALLAVLHLLVAGRIERDAEAVEPFADAAADLGGVLADTAGEDDGFSAVHPREVGADVLLHPHTEE